MNINSETMPLPALIDVIVERTSVSKASVESFVTAVTETITTALRNDQYVRIKGLGAFRTDSENNITFEADQTIAAEINTPFSIFEPVEIDGSELPTEGETEVLETTSTDGEIEIASSPEEQFPENQIVKDQTINLVEIENEPADDAIEEPVLQPIENVHVEEASIEETPVEKTVELTETEKEIEQENFMPQPVPTEATEPQVVTVVVYEHPWLTGILAALAGLLLGFVACYFAYPYLSPSHAKNITVKEENALNSSIATDQVAELADSVAVENEKENADSKPQLNRSQVGTKVVYDTIRPNRFLTTIALDHYGRKIFWVYIYEENKSKISSPDNIAANTIVVVPPAEKFGIKAGNKQSEEAAERKAIEILGDNR